MKRASFTRRRVVWLAIGLVVIFSSAQVYSASQPALASGQKTWGDTTSPITVSNGQTINDYQYTEFLRSHQAIAGDQSCTRETLPLGPEASGFGSYDGCWYDTSIGLIEKGGSFIKPKGQPYVGLVNNTESQLLPTPNPGVFVEVTNPSRDYTTYYINFRTSTDSQMTPTDSDWNLPFYSWNGPATSTLTMPNGSPWAVDDNLTASQIGYSNDGQWMSIWENQGYVVVVNLNTFNTRVITVEPAAVANNDQDFAATTVSNGGRYLAVGIFGKPTSVFDLDNCATDTVAVISGGEECSARFLGAPLSDFTSEAVDASWLPHFYEEGLLGTYARCPDGVLHFSGYCEFLFRAPNSVESSYIALGDSYASGEGEGNSNFYPETDIPGTNMCHLAKDSYPFLIGKDLQLTSTHSVACSGAKTNNIANGSGIDKLLSRPSRDNQYYHQPTFDYTTNWTPGYVAQINYIDEHKPNIVTVSIGGNDVGFKDILERCVGHHGTCYKSYEDRLELVNLINNRFDKLVSTYDSIKQTAAPDTKIYVIGYPSIVRPEGNCGDNVQLDSEETIFANELENYLNSVIELATQKAGVYYVNDSNVFSGHRLCEVGEKAVNGVTFGNDTGMLGVKFLSTGSFHPTVYGHELLAKWIEQATDDFTKPMPRADDSILNPVADSGLDLLQAEKTNRPTYEVVYLDVTTNQYVYRSGATNVSYTSGTDSSTQLEPFTSVQAELHSDPIDLGTFTTDAEGNFSGSITIPASVPTGFHALNFYAMGTDGQMHEITQTIYVADQDQDAPVEPPQNPTSTTAASGTEVIAVPSAVNSDQPNDVILSSDFISNDQSVNEAKENTTTGRGPRAGTSLNPWPIVGALLATVALMVLLFIRYAKKQ